MNELLLKFCNFVFGKHSQNALSRKWILLVDMVIVIGAYFAAIANVVCSVSLSNRIPSLKNLRWLVAVCRLQRHP